MRAAIIVLAGGLTTGAAGGPARADELPADVVAALKGNGDALAGLMVGGHRERKLLVPAADGLSELGTLEKEGEFIQRIGFVLKLRGVTLHEALRYPAGEFNSGKSIIY